MKSIAYYIKEGFSPNVSVLLALSNVDQQFEIRSVSKEK